MYWVNYFLSLAITGLIIGGLARLVLPGREAIGMFGTILAGLAGSLVGAIAARFLFGSVNWLVLLGLEVAGAVLFILPYRVMVYQPTRPVVVDRSYVRPGLFSRRRRLL